MKPTEGMPWTIDELGARAAEALTVDYPGAPNDRVRAVPDRRTIRYYTTLGLLDRPASMRGRTALYGRRHLMQLVAIKRLQAEGRSLAEVQRELIGLTDAALARLARLPDSEGSPPARRIAVRPGRRSSAGSDAFWKSNPANMGVSPRSHAGQNVQQLRGVALGPGLTLLLESDRALGEEDVGAIRRAAGPLIRWLEAHRLVGGPDGEGGGRDEPAAADVDG